MTIMQKEDAFFANYPSEATKIVRDGIVEEGSYQSSKLKVLFLLKEVNSPGEGGWKLIDHIKSNAKAPTFDNLARWMTGIRNLPKDVPWNGVKNISPTLVFPS